MKELAMAIQKAYPEAVPGEDYEVVDRREGAGPEIAYWNALALGPLPTTARLETAGFLAAVDAKRAEIEQRMEMAREAIAGKLELEARLRTNAEHPKVKQYLALLDRKDALVALAEKAKTRADLEGVRWQA